jgi:hypothetical protein
MATAWVGEEGEGKFAAHVDYSEPRPFCFMQGPSGVSAEEAVAWARAHATWVIVSVGGVRYSAGPEPVADFPAWTAESNAVVQKSATGPAVDWLVKARTGWSRRDREDVARRLAELAARDTRASGSTASLDSLGFGITFSVSARSDVEAHEIAFAVIRDAWDASGIEAVPGKDFDISSVEVEPLRA